MRTLITAAVVAVLAAGGALAQGGRVYTPGEDGVTSPVLIKQVKPRYTDGAMQRKVEGVVEYSAVVQSDGTIGDIRVTRSLDEELDQQGIEALRQWEFKPGTKDGKAVDVRVSVELSFTLKK